jgi:hypothetical protein
MDVRRSRPRKLRFSYTSDWPGAAELVCRRSRREEKNFFQSNCLARCREVARSCQSWGQAKHNRVGRVLLRNSDYSSPWRVFNCRLAACCSVSCWKIARCLHSVLWELAWLIAWRARVLPEDWSSPSRSCSSPWPGWSAIFQTLSASQDHCAVTVVALCPCQVDRPSFRRSRQVSAISE